MTRAHSHLFAATFVKLTKPARVLAHPRSGLLMRRKDGTFAVSHATITFPQDLHEALAFSATRRRAMVTSYSAPQCGQVKVEGACVGSAIPGLCYG